MDFFKHFAKLLQNVASGNTAIQKGGMHLMEKAAPWQTPPALMRPLTHGDHYKGGEPIAKVDPRSPFYQAPPAPPQDLNVVDYGYAPNWHLPVSQGHQSPQSYAPPSAQAPQFGNYHPYYGDQLQGVPGDNDPMQGSFQPTQGGYATHLLSQLYRSIR